MCTISGAQQGGVPIKILHGPIGASAPKSINSRTVLRAAHVARTDIAVHRPARVQQRQRGTNIAGDRAGFAPSHGCEFVQVAAVQQLHRVVRPVLVDRVVVYLHDAWVHELRERVVLAFEQAGGALSFLDIFMAVEPFERLRSAALQVGDFEHRRHAAAS